MTILIENFSLDVIIGVLEVERVNVQKIDISLEIDYAYHQDLFIDYVTVVDMIKNYFAKNKPLLIEEAIEAICKLLKSRFDEIKTIKIAIFKPEILAPIKVGVRLLKNY